MKKQIRSIKLKKLILVYFLAALGFLFANITDIGAEGEDSINIGVASDGAWSSTAPGIDYGPFTTLEEARQQIRDLKAQNNGQLSNPVNVYIEGGTYYLDNTFELTANDSGTSEICTVTYQPIPGEEVVIRGSKRLVRGSNWSYDQNILTIDLSRLEDFANNDIFQVYLNGNRLILARYPDYNPLDYGKYTDGFLASDKYSGGAVPDYYKEHFKYTNERRLDGKTWLNSPDLQVVIFPSSNYGSYICGVASIDTENKTVNLLSSILTDIVSQKRPNDVARFYFQNISEELTTENEWYYDGNSKTLKIYLQNDLSDSDKLTVSTNKNPGPLVKIIGASHIYFNGLYLEESSSDGSIGVIKSDGFSITNSSIKNSVDIKIVGCQIKNCDDTGVRIKDSSDIIVSDCEISYVGGAGIYAVSANSNIYNLESSNYVISSNRIHNIGGFGKAASGIYLNTVGSMVTYNHISNVPRIGISFNGNDNEIAYNYVHHVNRETEDSGAIKGEYQSWIQRGNNIHHNYIHDTGGYHYYINSNNQSKWITPCATYGIYLDDFESGNFVRDNTILNSVLGAIMIHSGRDNIVENNTIVNSASGAQVYFVAWHKENETLKTMWQTLQKMLRSEGYIKKAYYDKYNTNGELESIPDPNTEHPNQEMLMVNNKFRNNLIFYPAMNSIPIYFYKWLGINTVIGNNSIWYSLYDPKNPNIKDPVLTFTPNDKTIRTWSEWVARGYDRDSDVSNYKERTGSDYAQEDIKLFINKEAQVKKLSALSDELNGGIGLNGETWYDLEGNTIDDDTELQGFESKILLRNNTPTLHNSPSNLRATALSSDMIELSWLDNSNSEAGFIIERSLASSGPFAEVTAVGVNSTKYIDWGYDQGSCNLLQEGTTYYYQIEACTKDKTLSPSNIAFATTLLKAPLELTVTAISPTQVNLMWKNNSQRASGFNIERKEGASGRYSPIATVSGTSYSDINVTVDKIYYYRVRAYNGAGVVSEYSNEVSAPVKQDVDPSDFPPGWSIYSRPSIYIGPPATIKEVWSHELGKYVIQLSGQRKTNGYRYRKPDNTDWNETSKRIIQWKMKYSESYEVFISCDTTAGQKYLYYTGDATSNPKPGNYIHHGLGLGTLDGKWHTITRNLNDDLRDAYPNDNVQISDVNAFLIRGSGEVADIVLLDETTNFPPGWSIYTGPGYPDATIREVWSHELGKYVIQLRGEGKTNGYRYRKPDNTDWNETSKRIIQWKMKYSESYQVFISCDTTAGQKYLYYTGDATSNPKPGNYIQHGLGPVTLSGQWVTVSRNLNDDLHDAEPGVKIIDVNAFLIRGSGEVADIVLLD